MEVNELNCEELEELHKCSQKLSFTTRHFWHGRGRPQNSNGSDYCQNRARYRIDGGYFCKKHGGFYLIEKLSKVSKDD